MIESNVYRRHNVIDKHAQIVEPRWPFHNHPSTALYETCAKVNNTTVKNTLNRGKYHPLTIECRHERKCFAKRSYTTDLECSRMVRLRRYILRIMKILTYRKATDWRKPKRLGVKIAGLDHMFYQIIEPALRAMMNTLFIGPSYIERFRLPQLRR